MLFVLCRTMDTMMDNDTNPYALLGSPQSDMENDPDFKKIREWLSEAQSAATN